MFQIVELFLQFLGLDIIIKKEPKPLLTVAAMFGHLPLVKLLVQSGTDPLLCEQERSMNALHEASLKGMIDVVRYLLSIGVEVDVKNAAGETSLHLAAKSNHVDVAECLIKHGADVKQHRAMGHTALHFAAARGDIPLARLLLDAGAEMEASFLDVGTPLYISAERGQVYMTRFLLKRGAVVDHPCTKHLMTPLHVASAMGQLAVIEALLTAGAGINGKNALLQRPEEIIGSRKSLTVVERALIESAFSRFKKKKLQERKNGKAPPTEGSHKKRLPTSPSHKEIKSERRSVSPDKPNTAEPELSSGEDPKNVEDVPVEEEPPPSSVKQQILNNSSLDATTETIHTHRRKPSLIDQFTGRRTDGFRLFDIKEFISSPSQDDHRVTPDDNPKERPGTARTPRRTSFTWSRLQRQPGSARANYRYATTESPRKERQESLTKTTSKRLSRSGSMSVSQMPPSGKSSSVTKSHSSHSVNQFNYTPTPSRESSCGASDNRTSARFKRIPKSKRPGSQDSGTQTDKSSFRSRRSDSVAESVDARGRSHLFMAANCGNIGTVDRLLASGLNPNVHVEEHGWTPLYAASRNGHLEVVKRLLQHGAQVNETINSGATAMHGACAFGQEQVARVLIDHGARLDMTTKHGELPLHTAARNGYMHVVSLLLATDKSLIDRKRFNDGSTALHLAVEKQWAGAVKELIDWGANPGIAKEDGITPLYMTSIPGNKSIAKMILDSSIPFDVNIQTDENWTALHVACARCKQIDTVCIAIRFCRGDLEMVRLLLRSGADPTLKTNMDMTPADVICEWVTADGGRTQRIREIIERPPTETSYVHL